ncbi:hypothetical protein D3C86_1740350 [compost metagenome]
MAFDPGGDVNQQGKTGGMAFRETVASETFQLLENTLCKFLFIAFGYHSTPQLIAPLAYFAVRLKCGHAATQAICLCRCKTCCNNCNFHGLLLEQGYT